MLYKKGLKMATPNPLYFACFPLQEYFVNKITGLPLSGGYVEFFSDPSFTVPKDVYQQTLVTSPTEEYQYASLGSTLVLSAAGTFVGDNGDDIIPFLFPYDGTPSEPGKVQPYFIRVWSGNPSVQGSVLQFTRQGWPPNLTQSTSPTDTFESSQNAFSNPEFSIVNFVPSVNTQKYTINVTTNGSFEIAPGWTLAYAGTGTLSVKQVEIVSEYQPTPSYAIEIDSTSGVTPITLTQRLYKSPRTFYGTFLSVAVLAACKTQATSATVTIDYIPNSGTSYTVASGETTSDTEFSLIAGVDDASVYIDNVANTNPPSTGYIDLVLTVPSGVVMQYTSFLAVSVQNTSSLITNIQSTNAQQTNGMFWYYKPQLEYKPIPSYTLGWDWGINPCQELGTTVASASIGGGSSRYVADETIVFQNVNSAFACTFSSAGMTVNNSTDTSFAVIKYFEGAEARKILSTPLAVQLKAGNAIASTTNVNANISIWWTADGSLPDINDPNYYTLVSAVNDTTGVPTVGGGSHGTWYELPRSGLGAATANLKTSDVVSYDFNGWLQADTTPSSTATYCAIVIGVSKLEAGVSCTFEYCTLNAGYIPTRPPAMSAGENLTALQQFYEKSYDANITPGSNSSLGTVACYHTYGTSGGNTYIYPSTFSVSYKTTKRADAAITFYTPSGTKDKVATTIVLGGSVQSYSPSTFSTTTTSDWTFIQGQNGVLGTPAQNTSCFVASTNVNTSAAIEFQYVANARLGVV